MRCAELSVSWQKGYGLVAAPRGPAPVRDSWRWSTSRCRPFATAPPRQQVRPPVRRSHGCPPGAAQSPRGAARAVCRIAARGLSPPLRSGIGIRARKRLNVIWIGQLREKLGIRKLREAGKFPAPPFPYRLGEFWIMVGEKQERR